METVPETASCCPAAILPRPAFTRGKADSIKRFGEPVVRERYGNLFDMYERITAENPYESPLRIYPAVYNGESVTSSR
jgi:hypothetical protein